MKSIRYFIIGIFAAVVLGGGFVYVVVLSSNSYDSEYISEFKGAYSDGTSTGKIHDIELRADETTISLVSGAETSVWAYNSTVPGPIIRIAHGDTVRATLVNNLSQPTTIHWHGVRVPNSMDGVPGVTQDPVAPGDSFVYEFTPPDAGTFWFHPHVRTSEQIEHGLYGVLVVEDEFVEQYDQDVVWVVDDWRLQEDNQLNPNYNTRHDLVHDGRWGNLITVNGQSSEIITAAPGERIRLRMVNSSNGRVYTPDFSSLQAEIIAVDGMSLVDTMPASGFELAPGNRIDVEIRIPTESDTTMYVINDGFTSQTNRLGIVKVRGNPVVASTFPTPLAQHFPDWSMANQLSPTLEYVLNASVGGPLGISWTMNGQAFPNISLATLKRGDFSIVRFSNESTRLHPMHLHGQFFTVIARDGKPVDEQYWMDTVLVHSKETVDVAMVPTEAGVWALHCHILEHAEAGMLTTITVS